MLFLAAICICSAIAAIEGVFVQLSTAESDLKSVTTSPMMLAGLQFGILMMMAVVLDRVGRLFGGTITFRKASPRSTFAVADSRVRVLWLWAFFGQDSPLLLKVGKSFPSLPFSFCVCSEVCSLKSEKGDQIRERCDARGEDFISHPSVKKTKSHILNLFHTIPREIAAMFFSNDLVVFGVICMCRCCHMPMTLKINQMVVNMKF